MIALLRANGTVREPFNHHTRKGAVYLESGKSRTPLESAVVTHKIPSQVEGEGGK